jgi:hypothetical protein
MTDITDYSKAGKLTENGEGFVGDVQGRRHVTSVDLYWFTHRLVTFVIEK